MTSNSNLTDQATPVARELNSNVGRQWLQSMQTAGTDGIPTAAVNEDLVISIPDVGGAPFHDSAASIDHDTISQVLAEASESRLGAASDKVEAPAIADLPEKTTEWTEESERKDSNRTAKPGKESKPASKPKDDGGKLGPMVESILERFPLDEPAVILFVGSEKNIHTDETCARISSILASKNIGKVLLIDSDIDNHELTKASGLLGQSGISDVINKGESWSPLVYGGAEMNLEFMPSGAVRFDLENGRGRIRKVANELKRDYQFICVSAGDAHKSSAKLWTEVCDASYLLVSLSNTHETIARSAVSELQASGARLLGCIVTDAA